MKLRAYIEDIDFRYIQKWIQDERTHFLWCANLFTYPLQKENFNEVFRKNGLEWKDCPYIITEDSGKPIGFFAYNVNYLNNYGFLKFVVLDDELRKQGYGTQMIKHICKFAFEITNVSSIMLNVFDANDIAIKCYQRAGFLIESIEENVFTFYKESWGRYHMIIKK